jgi:pimeloyl-ACP methyl ester carboxylesterase
MPDREVRMTRAYIYYLDGAGGAGVIRNWSRGVRKGFLDAGYDGAGEVFPWQTHLGVAADQHADVRYKRSKAAELAAALQKRARAHPGVPVHLIGLSAGTAVLAFTLEALPEDFRVDSAILLGASLSADYDLTEALKRVREKMYVFTSEKDAVLSFLVPMAGTADRERGGAGPAGLRGFQVPANASAETRRQYSKLVQRRWTKAYERAGNYGGHTDAVNPRFVREHVAPLIVNARHGQGQRP